MRGSPSKNLSCVFPLQQYVLARSLWTSFGLVSQEGGYLTQLHYSIFIMGLQEMGLLSSSIMWCENSLAIHSVW